MASSFDRVCESFTRTAEWKDLTAKFREEMRAAGLVRWEFSRQRNYSTGKDEIVPRYILSFGTAEVSRAAEALGDGFTFPSGDLLEDERLNRVARVNFGTRKCPTYNCKLDKLLGEVKKEKAPATKWPEYARKALVEQNKDVVVEMEARVKAQFRHMASSQELQAERQRFYERGVIDEIRAVVLKYYGKVTPEVLKEALDEVVAHAIMES